MSEELKDKVSKIIREYSNQQLNIIKSGIISPQPIYSDDYAEQIDQLYEAKYKQDFQDWQNAAMKAEALIKEFYESAIEQAGTDTREYMINLLKDFNIHLNSDGWNCGDSIHVNRDRQSDIDELMFFHGLNNG